jgi:predicted phosphodiesterase
MINNVLVVGDLHAPFIREGYLEHCKKINKDYKCNRVIFTGDILDNHFSSYYETNPDGLSAVDELDNAAEVLLPWIETFPKAVVLLGNHDRLVARKAVTAGLSKRWVRDFSEVICALGWDFQTQYELDNVLYVHGEGCKNLVSVMLNRRRSMVIGHWHYMSEIVYNASSIDLLWGMAVGCGINDKAYAFEYGQFCVKKSIIACGVVLNDGQLPILLPMNLNNEQH